MKNMMKRYVLGVLVAVTTVIAALSTDTFSEFLERSLAVTDVVMVLVLFGIFAVSQVGGNPLMNKLMMSGMRSDRRFTQLTQTFFAAAASYAVLLYLTRGLDNFSVIIAATVVLGMFTNIFSGLMSGKCASPKPSSEIGDMDGMSRSSGKEASSEMIRMPVAAGKAKKKRKKKRARRKKKSRKAK